MLKAERKWIDWMIRQKNILLFLIVTCLAILARVGGLSFVSADMNDYLLPWAEQFRANSGFSAMRTQIGDYNFLYQAIIILICRLPGSMVHLYKYISIFFVFIGHFLCCPHSKGERRCGLLSCIRHDLCRRSLSAHGHSQFRRLGPV